MLTGDRRLARIIAVLLAGTAMLFVFAVSAERSGGGHPEPATAESSTSASPAEHAEGGETETETAGEHAEPAGEPHSESESATLLGVGLESPALAALGALLSVALAAALWFRPGVPLLAAAGVFSAGFTVLDLVEAGHQNGEGNTPLTLAAVVLVIGHAAAAALALGLAAKRCRPARVAT